MTKILYSIGNADPKRLKLAEKLYEEGLIDGVKVGIEFASDPRTDHTVCGVLSWFRSMGAIAFADFNLYGTPKSVAKAIENFSYFTDGLTIAAAASGVNTDDTLKAAIDAAGGAKLFGVAVLTSSNYASEPWRSPLEAIRQAAYRFERIGIPGVTCGVPDLRVLRTEEGFNVCARETLVLGVRPKHAVIENDDQQRIGTPGEAARLGATYIAIDRAISQAADPFGAAKRIRDAVIKNTP